MKGIKMNVEDPEVMLYKTLANAKNEGVYDLLGKVSTKVINLYMKRFGTKEYALSIDEMEFTEQLIDCVNHLNATDEDTKKFFEKIQNEDEQSIIIASISALMLQ
jgi:hypothetical protein